MSTLAIRLRKARESLGMTQEQLAAKAKTSQYVITKIEQGKTKMPREILEIAKALNISPAWLMFGDDQIDLLTPEALAVAIEWSKLAPDQQKTFSDAIKALVK